MKIRAVLIDDDHSFKDIVEAYLADSEIEIIGTASKVSEGIKLAQQVAPDVVLVDINISSYGDGFIVIKEILKAIKTKVVILSNYTNAFEESIEAGAAAYVNKSEIHLLADEIRRLFTGQSYSESIIQKYKLMQKKERMLRKLSITQRDLVDDILMGLTTEEIAQKQYKSVNIIKSQKQMIYKLLNVKDYKELIDLFFDNCKIE
jgi:DNA-binding NarL/FixJ family response regulator